MILILNYKTYFRKLSEYQKHIQNLESKNVPVWHAINPYFYLDLRKKFPKKIIGLQNLSLRSSKPLTGEIVADFELVKKANFVLLGHSERFKVGENQTLVKEKIKLLQDLPFKLVIFFSELSFEPKTKFSQVKRKTEKIFQSYLKTIKEKNLTKVIFVYEPWWAISSEKGQTPNKEFLQAFLDWFRPKYPIKILYGGSFTTNLALTYQGLDFDGFVLGRAATKLSEIKKLAQILQNWS